MRYLYSYSQFVEAGSCTGTDASFPRSPLERAVSRQGKAVENILNIASLKLIMIFFGGYSTFCCWLRPEQYIAWRPCRYSCLLFQTGGLANRHLLYALTMAKYLKQPHFKSQNYPFNYNRWVDYNGYMPNQCDLMLYFAIGKCRGHADNCHACAWILAYGL